MLFEKKPDMTEKKLFRRI